MYCRAVSLCAAAVLLAVSVAAADDKPAGEKPQGKLKEGADLPGPFHPYNVANGKYETKFHSLTNEHGLNPGVMIFVQNVAPDTNSPLVKLLRELDTYIVEKPRTRLRAFAVFLFNDMPNVVTDDDVREAHAQELQKLKSAEPPLQQVVLALDSAGSLQKAGYDIPPSVQVRVVLYDQLKAIRIKDFNKAVTDADVKAIMDEVRTKLAPSKK